MATKGIQPRNEKEQSHGYCGVHWSNGELFYKAYHVNGTKAGYEEYYGYCCKLTTKRFYLT